MATPLAPPHSQQTGLLTHGPGGTVNEIQAYVLPVNYTEFEQGYLEDTVGPFMKPGPQQVSASVTMSQAGDSVFDLEQWNGRYHGTYPGNDNSLPCPILNGQPQLAVNNNGCNTQVPNRWGGPSAFQPLDPPQWTDTTLPIARMIRANTGKNIPPASRRRMARPISGVRCGVAHELHRVP